MKRLLQVFRHGFRSFLFLTVMVGLAMSNTRLTHGQTANANDTSPRVIASTPAEREVVPTGRTVEITFDQPMDRKSVESAFSVFPLVEGKLEWLNDTTLTFMPASPLKRGETYTVDIATSAKSTAGLPLEEKHRLNFAITSNLAVNQIVPTANAQAVEAKSNITVVFDRPVVPLVTTDNQASLPQPITISPAVEGTGEWVGTSIYQFKPTKALGGGTNYTVTVSGDLKDIDGNPLDKAFSWSFTTIPPQILSIYPNTDSNQILLDQPIQVQFNQPMDQPTTRQAFTIRNTTSGADVAGAVSFNEDGTLLMFKPASRFELGTRYHVEIRSTAQSATGDAKLTNPTTANFTTVPYPAVIRTQPINSARIQPGGAITIEFNTQMDPKTFQDRLHIDPKPENLNVYPGGNYLSIQFAMLPVTTYKITLDAGVADIYGNQIKEPFTFSFSTTDYLPSLYPVVRDQAAFTSAYRPETTILTVSTNIQNIDASLASLTPAELAQAMVTSNGYLNLYQYRPAKFTRQWTQKTDAKPNTQALTPLWLSGEPGGKLAAGMYYVEINSPQISTLFSPREPHRQLLIVATAAMTVKTGPDEILVWLTDLKTGQAVPNGKIDVYNRMGQIAVTGTTDASGLFRGKISNFYGEQPYWVAASGDGIFSFGSSQWVANYSASGGSAVPMAEAPTDIAPRAYYDPNPRQDVVYLYTDQPVYRPARPVYFRGIVRNQDDVTFAVPAGQPLQVIVRDQEGKELQKQDVTLNAYGAFNGKYDLPQNTPLGNYIIEARYKDRAFHLNFQVAEFRPPEFVVSVKPEANRAASGDTIKLDIDSTFFFGGPVSNANVSWVAIANQGFFTYFGDEPFDFYYPYGRGPWVYNREVARGQGKLDASGRLHIEIPADLGGIDVTQAFTIEASVTDVSNQVISGRTNVTVYPATVFVGLQPSAYVGEATKPLDVKVALVDWDSKPQAGQTVNMTVVERRWEQDPKTFQWSQKEIPVTDGRVTTDNQGRAVFTFTPPRAGIYEVSGIARDSRERMAKTTSYVWVRGKELIDWNQGDKSITLVADKKSYKPGDSASILIASPFAEPVQALVTVERARVMKTEIVTITGSYTYTLPLETLHSPNVYISVALMRGSGEITKDKDTPPDLRFGTINLDVAVTQQLKVKITPSTDRAEPGKEVKFDVLTTDLNDKPVPAEVGLRLSDLANLSVGRANSVSIFDFFWHPRGLAISTSTPLTKLIDDLTSEEAKKLLEQFRGRSEVGLADAAGGAPPPSAAQPTMTAGNVAQEAAADGVGGKDRDAQKQATAPTPRSDFVDTPLWLPDLATDDGGKASASVKLPDNLTTWRLDARAISKDTFVGDTTVDVVSTKPLLVRPSTPRFFVVGDETELAMVVNNNTDQDLTVQVALQAKGVTLKAAAEQTINVPKAGRARVTWAATVGDVENVDLAFSAVSGQYSDASKPAVGLGDARLLPVYRYLAPDYVATAGVLTKPGARTEAVIVPSATMAPTGELTLRLNPSLAATTLDGLKYLRNYPYQCVEQTVSKFLPNVITYRALQKLQLDKPELRANLMEAVQYAVARLQREQHGDGGWGWFPNDQSNPLTTSYALLGLVEAKASDLGVDEGMIQRAVGFLMSTNPPISDSTPVYELNRTAFVQYVLAKAQSPNQQVIESLFTRREKMNLYARAWMAQTYQMIGNNQPKIDTLLSDLQTAAVVSATGTHWEEKSRDWWNWDSDTRTTAIVLQTLALITPKSELIPNIVRWLMVARRGDAWETTQESAWAVMALTNWMDVSGELKADYAYAIKINDKQVGDGKANADTLRDTKTLQIAVADMLREQANRVVFEHSEGAGSLYYTATLHVNQPVDAIKPTNRGFAFNRVYYVNGKPVTTAKVGDEITVVVEITANNDMYYVNVEDPIPAGTELLDKSLLTTSQVGQPPRLENVDARYGWGWWYFSNTEMRTEKMVLSATYLPRGSYRFVYQIRASSPGVYRVIPTNGQQFYFPEVFGRGAGSLFTVTP